MVREIAVAVTVKAGLVRRESENEVLVLYPETQSNTTPVQLRNRQDAEVVGQVMAVARRLS